MMNTRKTQAQDKEDMLLDLYKIHAYNPNDAMGNPLTPFGNFCAGYEACQALNDKRIAELEEKLRVAGEALSEIQKIIWAGNWSPEARLKTVKNCTDEALKTIEW